MTGRYIWAPQPAPPAGPHREGRTTPPSGAGRDALSPVLGIVVLGYTLFRNVWPLPTGVNWWSPAVAIAWFVIGIIWVLARPAATRRAGELLTRSEGLAASAPAASGLLPAEGAVTS